MHFLRTLRISSFGGIKGFNIPEIVQENWGLQTLEVHVSINIILKLNVGDPFAEHYRNLFTKGNGGILALQTSKCNFQWQGIKKFRYWYFRGNI